MRPEWCLTWRFLLILVSWDRRDSGWLLQGVATTAAIDVLYLHADDLVRQSSSSLFQDRANLRSD
jgi:hypothetical protein